MIKSYILSTFRNINKRKTYFFINVLGLASGLASFMIIFLFITDELIYDRHHHHAKNIYRLVNIYDFEGVGENSASSPFPVAFALKNDFGDKIKNVVRIFNFQAPRSFIEYEEKKFNERGFYFADSTYFEIFDHRFVQGISDKALDENNVVVITESMARKYFGNENPLGKSLKFEGSLNLMVTGIIEDVPEQSHFRFDFLASMSTLRAAFGGQLPKTWVWNPCWTYLLLDPNADPRSIEEKFPEFIDKYFYDAEKDNVSLYLQPLTDIHLKSKLDYELAPNNDHRTIVVLIIIATFLIIIAIINYVNLATATSSSRAKEIGIKKINGANQSQLMLQFIGESVVITLLALLVAFVVTELALPFFSDLTGKTLSVVKLFELNNLILILGLGLVTGILAGIYPAFYISRFKPISVFRTKKDLKATSSLARKILVVLQFTISIALIIGTIVIREQLQYLQNADLGFNKDNMIVLPVNRTPVVNNYKSFKDELLMNSFIVSVTAMDDIFGASHNTHEFRPEGMPEDQWQFYPALVVQYDFLKTFDIKLLAGRDYQEENKTDPAEGILINEAMVRHMGWSTPQQALGKKFKSLQGDERVIGVFADFHPTSLHEISGPFVLNMKETLGAIQWFLKYMVIRVIPGRDQEALDFIEAKWKEVAPQRPFEYFYLDQELAKLYSDEKNLSTLSFIFTLIIIFIASLGLVGLASFVAEQRTKEIGIRKVLGATTLNIIKLLSVELVWLVLFASLLAWLIAFLVMKEWLNHFPYQAPMNWYIFGLASVIALILSLLIAGIRGFLASMTNPVITLKYE